MSTNCTIWIKDSNDRYSGIPFEGDIEEVILKLNTYYRTKESIENLIDKSSEPFKNFGLAMMKTASKEFLNGSYCFIFDEKTNEWWFGDKMQIPLSFIVNRLT